MPSAQAGGSLVTGGNIIDDTVTNADIASNADIELTKLNIDNEIDNTELADSVANVAEISVSSAEILALAASPKELIAAPGAGKVITVDDVTYSYTHNGTSYANGSSIIVTYTGGTTHILGNAVTNALAVAVLTGSANYVRAVAGDGQTPEAQVNTAVVLKATGAEFITGNGTLKIFIRYRILTL